MNDTLKTYSASRESLLTQIVHTLSADERFTAAWLTGSFGRNDGDALSDLDLTVVVADPASERLCARPWLVGAQTTPERFALFSQFGQPAVIHENHHNAPEDGTFTFVLYASSALMVDWVLIPQAKAQRPSPSRALFEKVNIPICPTVQPESLDQRLKTASGTVAFFWMMTAVTAKYIARRDSVFIQCWLDTLHKLVRDVEHLIAGEVAPYQRGSLSSLATTSDEQIRVLYRLSDRMLTLMAEVTRLGGYAPPSPLPTIEVLLNLARDAPEGVFPKQGAG